MRRNTLFECTDVLKINSKKKFKKILEKTLDKDAKMWYSYIRQF